MSPAKAAAACAALVLGHCGAMLLVASAALWDWPLQGKAMAATALPALCAIAWRARQCRRLHGGRAAAGLGLAAFAASALYGAGLAFLPMLALCRAVVAS